MMESPGSFGDGEEQRDLIAEINRRMQFPLTKQDSYANAIYSGALTAPSQRGRISVRKQGSYEAAIAGEHDGGSGSNTSSSYGLTSRTNNRGIRGVTTTGVRGMRKQDSYNKAIGGSFEEDHHQPPPPAPSASSRSSPYTRSKMRKQESYLKAVGESAESEDYYMPPPSSSRPATTQSTPHSYLRKQDSYTRAIEAFSTTDGSNDFIAPLPSSRSKMRKQDSYQRAMQTGSMSFIEDLELQQGGTEPENLDSSNANTTTKSRNWKTRQDSYLAAITSSPQEEQPPPDPQRRARFQKQDSYQRAIGEGGQIVYERKPNYERVLKELPRTITDGSGGSSTSNAPPPSQPAELSSTPRQFRRNKRENSYLEAIQGEEELQQQQYQQDRLLTSSSSAPPPSSYSPRDTSPYAPRGGQDRYSPSLTTAAPLPAAAAATTTRSRFSDNNNTSAAAVHASANNNWRGTRQPSYEMAINLEPDDEPLIPSPPPATASSSTRQPPQPLTRRQDSYSVAINDGNIHINRRNNQSGALAKRQESYEQALEQALVHDDNEDPRAAAPDTNDNSSSNMPRIGQVFNRYEAVTKAFTLPPALPTTSPGSSTPGMTAALNDSSNGSSRPNIVDFEKKDGSPYSKRKGKEFFSSWVPPSDLEQQEQQQIIDDSNFFDDDDDEESLPDLNDRDVADATVKIQKAFRGFQARKEVAAVKQKMPSSSYQSVPPPSFSSTTRADEEPINLNDPNLAKAAVKIQSVYRGFQLRKEVAPKSKGFQNAAPDDMPNLNDPEVGEAALKIQSVFRGFQSRKTCPSASKTTAPSQVFQADEEELPDLTDPDMANAAVKIQAVFRGFQSRRAPDKKVQNAEEDLPDLSDPQIAVAATKIQAVYRGFQIRKIPTQRRAANDDMPDLNDPEMSKAAVKIQAVYRGFQGRKQTSRPGGQEKMSAQT